MRFSQFAGTSIVPTLSRIVLALAFVTIGYNKVAENGTYTAAQANALHEMGVDMTPIATPSGQDEGSAGGTDENTAWNSTNSLGGTIIPAHFVQDGAEPGAGSAAGDQSDDASGGSDDAASADGTPAPPHFPLDDTLYEAKNLFKIALLVDSHDLPRPVVMAWVVAITELVGGGLLLIGFFSRVWGLGLAIAMGVAFALTSFDAYLGQDLMRGAFDAAAAAQTDPLYFKVFTQLALGVLAFGIFLTGPGPISVDRLIRGRGRGEDDELDLD